MVVLFTVHVLCMYCACTVHVLCTDAQWIEILSESLLLTVFSYKILNVIINTTMDTEILNLFAIGLFHKSVYIIGRFY